MQYWGGKLSAAQLHVTSWVGSVRQSVQGALEVVWGESEEQQVEKEEEDEEKEAVDEGANNGGRFQRAMSPLRSFARRSRRSLHHLSIRSRHFLQRGATGPSTKADLVEINSPQSDDKDTEALIEPAQDLQEVLSDHEQERESPVVVPDYVPEGFSDDPNTTDSHEEPEFPPFPESTTPLLDTSTLRSKVDLGRRRSRARPTRSFRVGLNQPERQDWRAHDSSVETRTSVKLSDSDSDEEQPKRSISRSPSTSQKVPAFPGVSPAALIAQLKKRTPSGGTGRGEQTEEDKSGEEKENQDEEVAAAPAPLPRSPRTASRLAGAALVLPPLGSKDGGAVASPAWLKELKSKKRSSHHDGVV